MRIKILEYKLSHNHVHHIQIITNSFAEPLRGSKFLNTSSAIMDKNSLSLDTITKATRSVLLSSYICVGNESAILSDLSLCLKVLFHLMELLHINFIFQFHYSFYDP